MSAVALKGFSVFGDDVYTSTDLNRRSGEVLNHARVRPVTISRNNEQFALLRREQAADLIRSVCYLRNAIELIGGALALRDGKVVPDSLAWLAAFDSDDRAKMCLELIAAIEKASNSSEWDTVDTLLHEWRESGLVAATGILDQVMSTPSDPVTLPDPPTVREEHHEEFSGGVTE